jgi:hypothetical protein
MIVNTVAESTGTVQMHHTLFADAVKQVSALAQAKLSESLHGRVQRATALVLNGAVWLEDDRHTCMVQSSKGGYYAVNGHCTCADASKAQDGYCKHRLAKAIYRRAGEVMQEPPPVGTALAEAQVETSPGIPAQYITYLHGKPFVRYAGLLALAHDRGLVSLKARMISVTAELALAEAEATFADGKTYSECADATPQNVPQHIRPHFPRMALTRSKAQALRDALNIGIAALEELDGE